MRLSSVGESPGAIGEEAQVRAAGSVADGELEYVLGIVRGIWDNCPEDVKKEFQMRGGACGRVAGTEMRMGSEYLDIKSILSSYGGAWKRVWSRGGVLSYREMAYIFVYTLNIPPVFLLLTTAQDLGKHSACEQDESLTIYLDGIMTALGKLDQLREKTPCYRVVSVAEEKDIGGYENLSSYLKSTRLFHSFTVSMEWINKTKKPDEVVVVYNNEKQDDGLKICDISSLSMNEKEGECLIYVEHATEVEDAGVTNNDKETDHNSKERSRCKTVEFGTPSELRVVQAGCVVKWRPCHSHEYSSFGIIVEIENNIQNAYGRPFIHVFTSSYDFPQIPDSSVGLIDALQIIAHFEGPTSLREYSVYTRNTNPCDVVRFTPDMEYKLGAIMSKSEFDMRFSADFTNANRKHRSMEHTWNVVSQRFFVDNGLTPAFMAEENLPRIAEKLCLTFEGKDYSSCLGYSSMSDSSDSFKSEHKSAESSTDVISTKASRESPDSKLDKQSTDRQNNKWIAAEIRDGKQPLGSPREKKIPDTQTSTKDKDTVARSSKVSGFVSGHLALPRLYRSGQRLAFW